MNDSTYYVRTSVGRFRVEKSVYYNENGSINYHMLKIGGQKFCIEYLFKPNSDVAELQWIFTEKGGCEMNGDKTIHLFYLSIALLKQYSDFKQIYFIDNSTFPCELPNGQITKISMNKYYILFHRKTWYEAKLNAYPKHPEDVTNYDKIKGFFYEPLRKSDTFIFKNSDLEKMLKPIYTASNTWAEFFDAVYKLPNVCQIIYPWHIDAIMKIKSPYALPEEWLIDINDKTPVIVYEFVVIGSGKRKSRKLPQYKWDDDYKPEPEEIRKFRYDF